METTIVRIKRHIEDSPTDSLLLRSKRAKTDAAHCENPVLFKYAGSYSQSDSSVSPLEILQSKLDLPKTDVGASKTTVLAHHDLIQKTQSTTVPTSSDIKATGVDIDENNLFHVFDAITEDTGESATSDKKPTKLKPVLSITCNGELMEATTANKSDDNDGYVYDLYLTHAAIDDVEEYTLEHGALRDGEVVYDAYKQENDEHYYDDEDSNAEDNADNDYPDEEEFSSRKYYFESYDDFDYLHRHMKRLDMGEDKDSDSDEFGDPYYVG